MKYRIRARSYRAYGGRPYDWQSGGLYDIEAAIQIMQRMYTIVDQDGMFLGLDVWLVPV